MRAWTFIILRNLFLSQMRRARFKGEWDDITASKILAAPASQDRHIELGDMQRALMHLPQPQREALILVGAGGFAYEEAAEICGCAVGTIKSRVARGRVALEQLLSSGKLPSRRQHKTDPDKSALQTIMGEVDELSRDHERLSSRSGTARQFKLRRSSAKSRSHGSAAAASKARRSAAVMPAWAGGTSTRMTRRSMRLTSAAVTSSSFQLHSDCKRAERRGSFVDRAICGSDLSR